MIDYLNPWFAIPATIVATVVWLVLELRATRSG